MKLSKEEITYIDDYLIKSGVKYWDVRLELLDHIINAVEDLMKQEGYSFNEALLEVHRDFGNQLIEKSLPPKDFLVKGLYQSNSGFKRLMKEKQIQGQKKLARQIRALTFESFKSPAIYFEFVILGLFTWLLYPQSMKAATFVLFGVLTIPFLITGFLTLKEKMIRKSLLVNHMAMISFGIFAPLNIFFNTNSVFNVIENKTIIFYVFVCFFILAYPFLRAQLVLFFKMRRSYKEQFKVLDSVKT